MTRIVDRGDGVHHSVLEEYASYVERYAPIVTMCELHIHVFHLDDDIVTCLACIAARPIARYP